MMMKELSYAIGDQQTLATPPSVSLLDSLWVVKQALSVCVKATVFIIFLMLGSIVLLGLQSIIPSDEVEDSIEAQW